MSDDKQRKREPPVNGHKPAAKTIVGVPSLPADTPSDAAMTHQLPATGADASDESTALDVKAMSSAEAERVLASGAAGGKAPGVAGALPKPATKGATPVKTPPLGGVAFKSTARTGAGAAKGTAFDKPTRPGIAPQTGISPAGRSTLLLDSSAPGTGQAHDADASAERPPIVVPSSGATPPKAVTQPPPWGEGAVRVSPSIPRGAPPPRARGPVFESPSRGPSPAIEEISGSLLLPADSTGQVEANAAEEISASLLIEDPADGKGPPVVRPVPSSMPPPLPGSPSRRPPAPGPSSHPPWGAPPVQRTLQSHPPPPPPQAASHAPPAAPPAPPPASHVPPAPPSAPPVSPSQRIALGMPELPKATPGPKLDFISATPAGIPIPEPVPDPVFPDSVWPPAPSPAAAAGAGGPGAGAAPGAGPRAGAAPSPPSAMTGDIELTQLPRGGLAPVIDRARAMLAGVGPAVRRVGPALRKLGPAARKLEPAGRKLQAWLQKLAPAMRGMLAKLPKKSALRAEKRPKWFLPTVAIAGLVVGIGLVGLLVSLFRSSDDAATEPSASARASALPSPSAVPSASAAPAPAAAAALAACSVAGSPHVLAPSAIVAAGVEVVPVGDAVGVGFAPSDHDAMAVRLDGSSLAASTTAKAHSADPVRRVTPVATPKGALSLLVDAEKKGDRLQGRRTVLADPPLQLGAADGALQWARPAGAPAGKLWPLDGSSPVDALRGAVEGAGGGTMAVAFRRDAAVWMGTAAGTPPVVPKGNLAHVDGLGTVVGSPALAVSDGVVLVAWSDRASSDEPWHLRWVRFAAGETPGPAQTFTPPAGGKGSQAMSPGLAAVPGGRFLLVWTEGPPEGHDVRALTLGADGVAVGAPLVISNVGVNAGQGQAAVMATGDGVVAFLESAGSGFQVVGTPIHCPL